MDLKGLDQGWGRGNKGDFVDLGAPSHNIDLNFEWASMDGT